MKKIFWYNPLHSYILKTGVDSYFLNLIDNYFPPHHKFHIRRRKSQLQLKVKHEICNIYA